MVGRVGLLLQYSGFWIGGDYRGKDLEYNCDFHTYRVGGRGEVGVKFRTCNIEFMTIEREQGRSCEFIYQSGQKTKSIGRSE